MLDCIRFILEYTAKFIAMLFTVPVGGGLSLGFMFCLCFILLPIVHRVICFLKLDAMEEIADARNEQKYQRVQEKRRQQRRKGGR